MGDLHEIVSVEAVDRLITTLAFVLPVAGALIGAAVGARRGILRNGVGQGFVFGLIGPLIFGMWRLYNAITDRNGLDTVRNLAINTGMFVTVGALIGLVLSRVNRIQRPEKQLPENPPDPPVR